MWIKLSKEGHSIVSEALLTMATLITQKKSFADKKWIYLDTYEEFCENAPHMKLNIHDLALLPSW